MQPPLFPSDTALAAAVASLYFALFLFCIFLVGIVAFMNPLAGVVVLLGMIYLLSNV
jgi:hypothetical protein